MHSKYPGTFLTGRNVLLMLKTFWGAFEVEKYWTALELYSNCTLDCFLNSLTAFHTLRSHSSENWNPWPHSLHQLIKHGRLHPEVVEERLSVFYSELLSVWPNIHTASCSPLPAMDWSDIFWVFSSFFYWPPLHLFQADLAYWVIFRPYSRYTWDIFVTF